MAQDLIGLPPLRGGVDEEDESGNIVRVSRPWSTWFTQVFQAVFSVYQSGTTAQRPTVQLWVGRRYFDTTLGIPVWYTAAGWVDATGSVV